MVNTELNVKNKELEQLLYVASHDLRSPLVNVQGFSKELLNDFQNITSTLEKNDVPESIKTQLEPVIKEEIPLALNFIGKSVEKMDSLLAGLLKISRLGRSAISVVPIEMNKLVAEAIENLEFQVSAKEVDIQVDDLPKCIGDELQIGQVFSNIIGNAIKFMNPDKQGRIKITGKMQENLAVYCVEDNGIGIEQAHQEKIFDIFHQLTPEEDGQGLGLNIVKKILERQGGEIWLESEVGKYSKFYVSLPKC